MASPQPSKRAEATVAGATRALVAFAVETGADDVPAPVLEALQALLVDSVGATYFGALRFGAPLHAYALHLGGAPQAALVGGGASIPAELAAAVNAQLCQLSGMESTGPGLHPGPLVVHTALAVGQEVGASGKDILAAMAVGYEAMCRFHFAQIGEPNVVHNNVVAAIIAARLLGLDANQTANAISLAIEFPTRDISYLRAKHFKRVSTIPMGFLFSVRAGIQAASLSRCGFCGLEDELDYRGHVYDLASLMTWETGFELTSRGIFLKQYPAGYACHMVLQMAAELRQAHNIRLHDISAVRVGVPDLYTVPHQSDPSPETHVQAVVSVPWAVSMQLHGVRPGPFWSEPTAIENPEYKRLAKIVELNEHPPASRALKEMRLADVEGWIEIVTREGEFKGHASIANTWGSSARPMPKQMISAKFRALAGSTLGHSRTENLLDSLWALPTLKSVANLRSALQ